MKYGWYLAAGAFFAGAATFAPFLAFPATTGGVTGIVLDARTAAPIGDAVITAMSPSDRQRTYSDMAGRFTFLSMPPDAYRISIRKRDYVPRAVTVTIHADIVVQLGTIGLSELKELGWIIDRPNDLVEPWRSTYFYSLRPEKFSTVNNHPEANKFMMFLTVPGIQTSRAPAIRQ